MTTASSGVFTIDYRLRTNAEPGSDIQFGMDFQLTQSATTPTLPLAQLIFPATAVGTNKAGIWNIDNHLAVGKSAGCLIFPGADGGAISDKPTELAKRNKGVMRTRFAVYRVDVGKNVVQVNGVTFGYSIDTDARSPVTIFTEIKAIEMPNEQRQLILGRCSTVSFR